MQPPEHHEAQPPAVKVRVPAESATSPADTRHLEEGEAAPQEKTAEVGPPAARSGGRGRRTRLASLGLVLVALGLVALATWWALSRDTRVGAPGQGGTPAADITDPLPENPVGMINSSTPLPARYSPLTVDDTLGEMTYAPESSTWTPALREAERARLEGRYVSAVSQYSSLVGSASREEAHTALWGLAESYEDSGQDELAIRAYNLFTYIRDDPRAARAYFRIAEIHRDYGRWDDAQIAYQEYNKHAGPSRHAVALLRARLLGSSSDAINLYKKILEEKPQDVDLREALVGLGGIYATLDRHDDAYQTFNRLASLQAASPRPHIDEADPPGEVLAARELAELGKSDEARQRLLKYMESGTNPAGGRYAALAKLLEIDSNAVVSGTVSPLLAAQVAFDAGYPNAAIGYLDTLRTNETDPARRAAAALLTGRAFSRLGDYASAYNWYTATVQTYPTSPQAAEASRRAGDALTEQAAWDQALGTYQETISKYPDSPEAGLARLAGGLLAYRLEQRDAAISMFQPLLSAAEISPTIRAEAAFWTGKIQKSQGKAEWKDTLKEVDALNPASFLGFRARSLLAGEPDGGPLMPTFSASPAGTSTLGIDFAREVGEREDLFRWASSLGGGQGATPSTSSTPLGTPKGTPAGAPPADRVEQRLASDPEVQRAAALLQLGYDSEALKAFEALAERLSNEHDALGLAQIVVYLRYHGDTRAAIEAAEVLGAMDKGGNPEKWPALLLKTIYPTPYEDLIVSEAQERDIDPLVVYALIKQESQFVPGAQSSAGARGLAQVIPSTGQGIADQLGDKDFIPNHLYWPHISIKYGTYYLASNLAQFDHKLLPTLAAYNGGPGNAQRWMSGSALLDPDLYAERIDLFETGDYVERVYVNYGFYTLVYGK